MLCSTAKAAVVCSGYIITCQTGEEGEEAEEGREHGVKRAGVKS